jgi:hypothetical protein
MDFSHTDTPLKNEEKNESDVDLTMFDSEDYESSDPDDCCHHIKKVSTNIQMFSIFITNLIITN